MQKHERFVARLLTAGLLMLISHPAFALNVGDSGPSGEMQAKLASENQTEILIAVTGTSGNLRGVRFYLNEATKVSYIALTNDPIEPTQMRIIVQTSLTDTTAKDIFGDPNQGAARCDQLISQKVVRPDNCAAFKIVLDGMRSAGSEGFLQGTTQTLNTMVSFINTTSGSGAVYEVTRDGASVSKLALSSGRFTVEGLRLFNQKSPGIR